MHVLRVLELLQEHLTEAVCQAAFARARTRERQRDGSLWALVQFQFWVSVILRAPVSLTQALEEVREGHDSLAAQIDTSPEAFFQRCKGLSPKFFAEVFRVFIARLREQVPPRYARSLHGLRERYADVLLIDGSRLASIAHRLKLLWDERSVVLPGCVLGIYDLFVGIPRKLQFSADAAAAEALADRADVF